MELTRRSLLVYGLLAAVWVLVLGWQVEEHLRVKRPPGPTCATAPRTSPTRSARSSAACASGAGRFRRNASSPVLNELVHGRTNELVKSSELISIALLDANNHAAGRRRPTHRPATRGAALESGEHWGERSVTLVNPGSTFWEGVTNTFIPPP